VDLLSNAIRPYAWGSRTTIAELLGRSVPTPHPEAELWLGAHPGDPSRVAGADGTEQSLLDVLAADPAGQLGEQTAARWGGRLPFLLKVLAAEEPLSLQAHPCAEQAIAGYAKEEAAGIPRDAANRNYPDPTAKSELVCALTEFHALAGFRDPHITVRLLRAVQTPGLAPYIDLLAGEPNGEGLRALFTTWITLPQPALDALEPQLLEACVRQVRQHGEFELECRTILQLAEAYPGDAGVLAALLLNRLVLGPGEAVFLPPGNLHAYLQGTAVEILANSDNILRGGLTPKHVDVPELLRVLDFRCGDMPVWCGEQVGRQWVYRTPAEEFELSRIDWAGADLGDAYLAGGRPRVLICMAGMIELKASGRRGLVLRRGQSVWAPASDPEIVLCRLGGAPAQVFVATVGSSEPQPDTL
jgi:mannose-6-phosphate isomerase